MAKTKVPTSKSVQDGNRAKAAKMLGGAAAKSVSDSIPTKKSGGAVKSSASSRADGCAQRGKTKGRFV